tara:strand:+ start:1758 stop:2198 length:441 start_codon:yes stop_codon:yes gene_type:complete
MIDGGVYTVAVPLGRSVAGFILGLFLGILGGWLAVIFNAMADYPWPLSIHRIIYLMGIGLGAGVGAYLAWLNLGIRRALIIGSVLLVLTGGISGAYLGYVYGQSVDPTYLGRSYTVDNWIHLGAAIGAIAASTTLGLIGVIRSPDR